MTSRSARRAVLLFLLILGLGLGEMLFRQQVGVWPDAASLVKSSSKPVATLGSPGSHATAPDAPQPNPADCDGIGWSVVGIGGRGPFEVIFAESPYPLDWLGRPHEELIQVSRRQDESATVPVRDAAITGRLLPVSGGGTPVDVLVSPADKPGEYVVEGARFGASGRWIIEFTITAGGESGRTTETRDVCVKQEG
jgi:hypothetical protein